MPDRDKVIKGLEICYCPPSKCEDCPYHNLPDEQSCNDVLCLDALALLQEHETELIGIRAENRKIFSENIRLNRLLKEQEAVEPYSMNAERTYGICPKCGKFVFRYSNVEENHYCGICGQAVKWNG